jgi:hypothetical protein
MNDDDFGATLLRPLRGEPGGPPLVDVPKAMRDGRRMRNRRWWSAGAAVFATLAAALIAGNLLIGPAQDGKPSPRPPLPPDPPLPAACTMTELPDGGNPSVEVTAGDSTGRWHVGTAAPVAEASGPLLVWHDGKLVATVPPPGGEATFHDVNSSGVAVGSNQSWDTYPFVYRNGRTARLKGGRGEAYAINDAGVIVGTLGVNTKVPVRWKTADAEPEQLRMPPGDNAIGFVLDIAADGTTIGMSLSTPYLWMPDGSVRKLTLPADVTFRPSWLGFGWVYGEDVDVGVGRYEPRTGTWQALTDDQHHAQVPGSGPGSMVTSADELAVFAGRQVLRLGGDPVPAQRDRYMIEISSISDDAHVVTGYALSNHSDPGLAFRSFIWRCR